MKGKVLLVMLCLLAQSVFVGAQTVTEIDSCEVTHEKLVRPQQIIVPAAMIAVGAVAVGNPRLCRMKYDVRNSIQDWRGSHRKANVETWASLSTSLIVLSLDRKPKKNSLVDRLMVKVTSYALLYTMAPITRRCVREARPDGHGNHSFVSFKAANAFMTAEQIRIEHGWGWGMGAYTMAAGISMLNMYNDRSYINDVLAGAGMGILATHAAYWLLPLERRWFGLDKRPKKKDASMMLLPTYNAENNAVGLAFTAVW